MTIWRKLWLEDGEIKSRELSYAEVYGTCPHAGACDYILDDPLNGHELSQEARDFVSKHIAADIERAAETGFLASAYRGLQHGSALRIRRRAAECATHSWDANGSPVED